MCLLVKSACKSSHTYFNCLHHEADILRIMQVYILYVQTQYADCSFTFNTTENPEDYIKYGTTEIAICGYCDVIMIIRHDHLPPLSTVWALGKKSIRWGDVHSPVQHCS